jgi:acyl-CoA reductase-like NAD-dependent aldehyde dehydrogenase
MNNNGESCIASKIIAVESIADEFIENLQLS